MRQPKVVVIEKAMSADGKSVYVNGEDVAVALLSIAKAVSTNPEISRQDFADELLRLAGYLAQKKGEPLGPGVTELMSGSHEDISNARQMADLVNDVTDNQSNKYMN